MRQGGAGSKSSKSRRDGGAASALTRAAEARKTGERRDKPEGGEAGSGPLSP